MTEPEVKLLMDAASLLRLLSRKHDDTFQKTRDSDSSIIRHQGRMSLEKAVQLYRMAKEIDMVASTDGEL